MKERLVEVLKGAERKYLSNGTHIPQMAEFFADYILENGVIVPPCKVGQTVYQIVLLKDKTGFIVERKVVGFHMGDFPAIRGHKRSQYLIVHHDATNSITHIDIKQIGKTVFLTREEAQAKLKEGGKG